MKKSIKNIALLTSGGDAPGMNAAIRSVVRTCVFHKVKPFGVSKGFDGLINGKMIEMNARSVKGIINKVEDKGMKFGLYCHSPTL